MYMQPERKTRSIRDLIYHPRAHYAVWLLVAWTVVANVVMGTYLGCISGKPLLGTWTTSYDAALFRGTICMNL